MKSPSLPRLKRRPHRPDPRSLLGGRRPTIAVMCAVLAGAAAITVAPAASAAAASTEVSSDDFNRANATGWGNAGSGGAYTLKGKSSVFAVENSKGVMKDLPAGGSAEAYLASVSAQDTLLQGVLTVPSVDQAKLGVYHALEARRQDDGTAYRGKVKLGANGAVTVSVTRTAGSAETSLGSAALPLTVNAGQQLNVQTQVTGTNPVKIDVRAWIAGAATPGWQYSASDSSGSRITAAGSVGIWDYVSSSSVSTTLVHDNFIASSTTATSTPAPAPAPAPDPAPAAAAGTTTYKSAGFDDMALGTVNPTAFNSAMGATNKNAAAYDDMSIVADSRGGKAVRTTLKAGTIHSSNGGDSGDNLFISLPASYDTACMQYDIKFDSNFDWSLGGKLPGLEGVAPGVAPSKPTGGDVTTSGWSGRAMWVGPKAYSWAGPTNMAVSYMYHAGQSGTYGDNVQWGKAFVGGKWHTIKQCYKMNTVGQSNGSLKAWMDGVQVVNDNAYKYRTRTDVHINYIIFALFRGGNTMDWAGSRNGTVDIDNVKITSS